LFRSTTEAWVLKIDISDLINSVEAIRSPGTRIGLPDDPTPVNIADSQRLSACMDTAFHAFRELRGGADFMVSAAGYQQVVRVRFVQRGPCRDRNGQVEPALELSFRALRAAVAKSRGELHYWGGNNYFDVSIPFRGPVRESFPAIHHLPWDERYCYLME